MELLLLLLLNFIDVLTKQPGGQLQKEHKYVLREKSQLHTIYISKTSKEKNKTIENKRQIQTAKDETYNI